MGWVEMKRPASRQLAFLAICLFGVAASYFSVNIPGTDLVFDMRWVFGVIGFAVAPTWLHATVLAVALSAAGFHRVAFLVAFGANLLFAIPLMPAVRLSYRALAARVHSDIGFFLVWTAMVIVTFQVIVTPLFWLVIAIVQSTPILSTIAQRLGDQLLIVQSLFIGVISALTLLVYRSVGIRKGREQELAKTLYSIADAVVATDREGRVVRMNREAERLLHVREKEARGRSADEFLRLRNDNSGERVESPIARTLQSAGDVYVGKNVSLERSDGTSVPIADSCSPIINEEGDVTGAVLVFRDQSEQRASREALERAVEEKEVLLRELYHRTKNNMNVIQSMLSLRSHQVPEPSVAELVRETGHRIHTIGLVHEKLYETSDLSGIDLGEYITELTDILVEAYVADRSRISFKLSVEPLRVLIDVAIPCGLLANELISNALKHAFPDDTRGEIRISVRNLGDHAELSVRDSGVGVPPGFDAKRSGGLGLQTVILLAEHQLQGHIAFHSDGGFGATIVFPHEVYAERV
jgi:PAS domain S-box-containing protein